MCLIDTIFHSMAKTFFHIVSSTGYVTYNEVRTFAEKDHAATLKCQSITTLCNQTLKLSQNHIVYARKFCSDDFNPM